LATALDALGQALGAEQGSIRLVARDITAHDTETLPMPSAAEDTGPSA
jgi:hypothetical protein